MLTRQTISDKKALEVVLIDSDKFHLFESFLTRGLDAINCKTHEHSSYEDIVQNCTNGSASLFVLYSPEYNLPLGFYVLTIVDNSGDISVDISSAYATRVSGNLASYYSLQKAIEFAIMVSAKEIRFSSPRKGVRRIAEKLGFSLINTIDGISYYFKGITDGS